MMAIKQNVPRTCEFLASIRAGCSFLSFKQRCCRDGLTGADDVAAMRLLMTTAIPLFVLLSFDPTPAHSAAVEYEKNRETFVPRVHKKGDVIFISTNARVAVSPDGRSLALWYDDPRRPWFGVYSITNDRFRSLRLPSRRVWTDPRWSSDSRNIVVASNGYDEGRWLHDRSETRLDVINPADGTAKTLIDGPGLRGMPFFSRDNQFVYYFKGEPCFQSCTSAGGKYRLYRVKLFSNKEELLTSTAFYQVASGDELPSVNRVIFSAYGYKKNDKPSLYVVPSEGGKEERIDTALEQVARPRADQRGRIFFSAAAGRNERGRYIYDDEQRLQYSVFSTRHDGSDVLKQIDLSWQREKETGRLHLSTFDIDADGNVLHCRSLNNATHCSVDIPFVRSHGT